MNNKVIIAIFIAAAALFSACNESGDGFSKNSDGLSYKFIGEQKKGKSPKTGDVVEFSVKYFTSNDSLLYNSVDFIPKIKVPLMDTATDGLFQAALAMMSEGDSAHFLIPAKNFFTKTAHGSPIPPYIKEGDHLKFHLKLHRVLTQEEAQDEEIKLALQKKAEEEQMIKEYLSVENIDVAPTESGLYIISLEKGKGKKAENEKTVEVHYTGTLLNGQKFDSSLDRNEPFSFKLGMGNVIKGWDEAVATMRVGDKIKVLIPSDLAYGPKGAGATIPPFTPLLFEIKLLAVK
ncbi:MAG: hypothetical protein CSB06_01670 [Bacteroidia bacterium]|nr:MAG: hypothetical protein CSB06_01670 [Bacteroidia bacterium]